MRKTLALFVVYLIALAPLSPQLSAQSTEPKVLIPPLEGQSAQELGVLQQLFPSRLNLNTASRAQLLDIPGLSVPLVDSIIAYRQRYGPLGSPYELAYIPGLNRPAIVNLLQFVSVQMPIYGMAKNWWANQQVDALQRAWGLIPFSQLPPRKYQSEKTAVQGSPLGLLTRATYSVGSWLRVGAKALKAPNEPFFKSFNPYGYGFYSGFIEISPRGGRLLRVVLGDYSYSPGYGLVSSSTSLRFPIYHTATLARRSTLPRGVLAYQGSDYPTGIALSARLASSLYLTLAYAVQPINARLETKGGETRIKRRLPSGPISTLSRLEARRSVWQQQAILDFNTARPSYTVGLTAMLLHHQFPFSPPYPRGGGGLVPPQNLVRTGLYTRAKVRELELWGEVAYQFPERISVSPATFSALAGFTQPIYGAILVGGYYYRYGEALSPIYEYSYALSSRPFDCQGIMLLLEYQPSYTSGISLRYQNQAPSSRLGAFFSSPIRRAIQLQAVYAEKEEWMANISYSYRWKALRGNHRKPPFTNCHHAHLRYERRFNHLILQSHILANATQRAGLKGLNLGYAFAQDFDYQYARWRIRARLGYHDATASQSPLYLYEPAPRYSFSIGTLTRASLRPLLMVEYRPIWTLTFSLRLRKDFYFSDSFSKFVGKLSPYVQGQREALSCIAQIRYAPKWK